MRSFLTLLGIIIGVLAVVTMFSSVYSLKAMVKKNMEGMGWNNSLIITPKIEQKDAREQKALQYKRTAENVKALNYSDFEAIKASLPFKTIYGMNEYQSLYRIKNTDVQVSLRGTNTSYFVNKTYALKSGRYFNTADEENGNPVVILGYYFAEEQFPGSNPVGKMINISGHRYRIIGILNKDAINSSKGMNFNTWERKNDLKAVYVPLKFAAIYLSSQRIVHYIYIQAKDEAAYTSLKTKVRQLLLARHSMYENFSFQDIGDLLMTINEEIDKNLGKWNITLFVIASISLIVGGIGLFSTLLISIQEKMLEIGVRKSIGATETDIFFYFIFEAVILAVIGALVGIELAGLALLGMSAAIKMSMPMPVQGMAVGLFFSILVGFVSGIYPALKAANLNPIKAIYYFD
jgi:putative ABC transport system permease protein